MKKCIIWIIVIQLVLVAGCVKDLENEGVYSETEIMGTIVERSTNTVLPNIKVKVTDGDHIHASTTTGPDGVFRLKVNFDEVTKNYYLLLDGSPDLPSKQELLCGMGKKSYDYKILVLYDKTDTNLLPHVITGEAINIMGHTATVDGIVSFSGGKPLTGRGVCYAIHQSPSIDDYICTAGSEVGVFNCNLTDLQTSTTYFYRAYATNSIGVSYGESKMFTTTDGLPSVTTMTPTNILGTTAQGGGTVTANGESSVTERGVCWNRLGNPSIEDLHTVSGAGEGSFLAVMSGLSPNTTYHVRAYATNSDGIRYGNEKTFTTTNGLPVVTSSIASYTATSAVLNGNVTNDNGSSVMERGFCWSTSQYPTVTGSHISVGSGTGNFSGTVTNLTRNTTYYVRAYATNSNGTSYSSQLSFQTPAGLPIVTTALATLNGNDIMTGGNVASDGGFTVTARGVCYGPNPNPDLSLACTHTQDGIGLGSFTTIIDNSMNSTLYIRAYATNANGTSYGEEYVVNNDYLALPMFVYSGHTYRVGPEPSVPGHGHLTWSEANNYCQGLDYYGISGWRLPTRNELEYMCSISGSIGGFDVSPNSGSHYWSGFNNNGLGGMVIFYSCTFYVASSYTIAAGARPVRVEN